MDLQRARAAKLSEQKALSDQLHSLLTKSGGLIESSSLTCKNLQVAVAVSKRPGFFEYYVPNEYVKRVIRTDECGALVRKMQRVQKELEAIEADVSQRRAAETAKLSEERPAPNVGSLDQWFAQYGRPKEPAAGVLTTFEKNAKIYGGTAHHRAFKTQALKMKKGRCL
ncbi:hypothetical protein M885DRAFT_521304 [Pelagophyceae sp. CCMP2097]|nr:hypothetical protein M885DRAFT_521304 [Pelagophyceae sp. CCMP2097]